jgi:hypothetical protein
MEIGEHKWLIIRLFKNSVLVLRLYSVEQYAKKAANGKQIKMWKKVNVRSGP